LKELSTECLYCGGRLEKGYLVAAQGIWWDDKKPGRWWTIFGKEAIVTSFGRAVVASVRCKNCGIALIRTKPAKPAYNGAECPNCGAIYNYSEDKIDENGFVSCQNCAESFLLD
jgi:hypothetical protein